MTLLYLDVETLPDPKFKEDIKVSPPGNMSKPETIEQWEKGEGKYAGAKEAAIEAEFRKFGLDGTKGQIFCIAWAFGDKPVEVYSTQLVNEKTMLKQFVDNIRKNLYATDGRPEPLKWIGHYITNFDLRFIWQRCVINGVKPSVNIPYDAKPWADNVFDTCIEWKGLHGQSSGSLNDLCKAFGLEGKGDLDGSKVYEEYLKGNYQEIVDYCKDDVEKVRQLYKRMTFN